MKNLLILGLLILSFSLSAQVPGQVPSGVLPVGVPSVNIVHDSNTKSNLDSRAESLVNPVSDLFVESYQIDLISQVARAEMLDYLNKIPVGQEGMFGFNDRSEFLKAEIGCPYEMITLTNDFINDPQFFSDKNYLVSTNNWRVPILVSNEARALLTVSNIANEWRVVKIGAKGLAFELQMLNQDNRFSGDLKILRVFQLKSDFLLTEGNIVYPLTSGKKLFEIKLTDNVTYSLEDMLMLLKNKITVK